MNLIAPAVNLAANFTLSLSENLTIANYTVPTLANDGSSDGGGGDGRSAALLDTLLNAHQSSLDDIVENVTSAVYEFSAQLLNSINATVSGIGSTSTTTTQSSPTPILTPTAATAMNANLTAPHRPPHNASALGRWLDNDDNDNDTANGTLGDMAIDMASIGVGNGGGATNSDYYSGESWDDVALLPCHKENPNFNCTRDEYVKFFLGPQTLPLYKALLVTIIFGGIFITGVLGNVLVCVVIVRHPTMHTATNYYLFSLAVSDLLYLLFGLPAEIVIYWHQYPYLFGLPFCKIRAFISEASTYVSVLTIVAFSMERFLAICHPLHLYAMSGFKRALRIIAILWVVSFISAIPFGLMMGIQYVNYPINDSRILESAFCSTVDFPENFPLFELSFCIFFVIPMIFIIILYGRMGAQIRYSTTQQLGVQQGSMHRESRHQQSRKAVIRMLAAVVITFFICWLPFHMQRLWFLYAKEHKNFQEINEWMFSITGFTYYVSCTINPILYNVMSHRYRVAFKDILWGKRRSVFYNNGFARDQSSFRETTVASTLCSGGSGGGGGGGGGGSAYDRVHSVRVRSIRIMNNLNNVKDRDTIKSSNALWMKKTEFALPLPKPDVPENPPKSTNVVVVVDNGGINGRPKVYTENEAQESLISKDNETCI